jgi:ligand-binding sensor domain-containing protein/signal transduction histidine kinase
VSARARLLLVLLALAPGLRASAAGLDPKKALTQYNLDVWTVDDGLPQNTVTALQQGQDGYLWIGTFGGLARFDGARFATFDKSSAPALPNSGVHALLPDKNGGLWIGTNGGGLTLLKDGTARTFTSADGLGGDVVRALHQDRRGRIWAGTNGGLSLLEGARFKNWGAAQGFARSAVRAIREDATGALWIGTNGDGLYRMQDGAFTRLTRKDGLPSDLVFSLLVDRAGALWVGTNGGGLARHADGAWKSYGERDGLQGNIIWTLHEDQDGRLWVGTYGAGLYRKDGERFHGLRSTTGLHSDFVRALAQDHEGSLWIGGNSGGLARLRDGKLTSYGVREGLPTDVAKAVLASPDGALWVGTSGGGLARLRDGRFDTWSSRDGLPNDFVQALLLDKTGALWIGTNGGGVARFKDGVFQPYGTREGLADDHVAALAQDQAGALWIGTNAAGLSRFENGRFTRFGREHGLGSNLVMALLVDRDDALWVGTDGGGLTRVKRGSFETFTSRHGLAADSVLSLYEDADGVLWIGTSGGGLSRLAGGRLASFSTRDGLHDDVVFSILEDASGGLWLSGNRGISRVEKRRLLPGARVVPQVFGVADGMKSAECSGVSQPAGTRLPGGALAFPTPRGIVMLDPQRLPRNEAPPPVHVEELLAGGRAYTGPSVALPRGADSWEIRFTGLSLLAPERVRFQYRLAGFDPDWVDAGARRSAFYTHVPPGDYRFEVHAANNDGVSSREPARLAVSLAPRLHETLWFRGAVGLGLVLLGAFAYALRVRGLESRRRELERLVRERTEALSEQQRRTEHAREEAERQRERAERQRELAQQAGAVRTEMLQIAAHDLKNPLQLVLGHAEMAQLSLEHGKPVGEFVGHIHLAAERMLAIVTRLLDVSAVEAGKIALKLQLLDLGDVARHVVETSRAPAARKGQELHLSIEGELPVKVDEERTVEVLDNLVGNAIKYSPFFSKIQVVARRHEQRALVEVKDAGPGLSDEDKTRIFGRFQRLSAKPTGGEAATGLGLSIAKQLGEAMGGTLLAESEGPGKGSCFTLSLPLSG